MLARVQDDIRHDRDPAQAAPLPWDGSVVIYACHGHVRQVEVLREALLHLFNDDPTLQAREVIVLCPDVDAFAPLIAAAFGPTNAPGPRDRRAHRNQQTFGSLRLIRFGANWENQRKKWASEWASAPRS